MPIYAYKCDSCGFAKDVLQKISDAPLDTCPQCSRQSFKKQLTAAGFQLKGSGWYVTDFKGGAAKGATANAPAEASATTQAEGAGTEGNNSTQSATSTSTETPAASKPAPAPSSSGDA